MAMSLSHCLISLLVFTKHHWAPSHLTDLHEWTSTLTRVHSDESRRHIQNTTAFMFRAPYESARAIMSGSPTLPITLSFPSIYMHILNLHMINAGRMKAFRLGGGDRGDRVMKGRCAGVLKRDLFFLNKQHWEGDFSASFK